MFTDIYVSGIIILDYFLFIGNHIIWMVICMPSNYMHINWYRASTFTSTINIKYWMFSYFEIGIESTCVGQWPHIYLSTNQNIDVYQSSGWDCNCRDFLCFYLEFRSRKCFSNKKRKTSWFEQLLHFPSIYHHIWCIQHWCAFNNYIELEIQRVVHT